MGESKGVLSAI